MKIYKEQDEDELFFRLEKDDDAVCLNLVNGCGDWVVSLLTVCNGVIFMHDRINEFLNDHDHNLIFDKNGCVKVVKE